MGFRNCRFWERPSGVQWCRPLWLVKNKPLRHHFNMLTNSLKVTNELQQKKLANELSVCKGSANNTTDTLGYSKMYASWVPWILTEYHKSVQKEVCSDIFSQNRADGKSSLSWIITEDKTWIHNYEPQTDRQLMEWHHPTSPQKKAVKATTSAEKSCPMFLGRGRGDSGTHFVMWSKY